MKIKVTEQQIKCLAGVVAGMLEAAGNDLSNETPRSVLYSLSGILPALENEWEKVGWPQRSMREMLAAMPRNFFDTQMTRLQDAAHGKIEELFSKRKTQA